MYTCIHCLSSELYVYRYYKLHNIHTYTYYIYTYICVMLIVFGSILKAFDSGKMATRCIYPNVMAWDERWLVYEDLLI